MRLYLRRALRHQGASLARVHMNSLWAPASRLPCLDALQHDISGEASVTTTSTVFKEVVPFDIPDEVQVNLLADFAVSRWVSAFGFSAIAEDAPPFRPRSHGAPL
jgi:hypothetical protein